MARGEGAFVIAEFLQQIREDGSIEERRTVKNWFDEEIVDRIKKSETKGRNVLLEKSEDRRMKFIMLCTFSGSRHVVRFSLFY